MSLAYNYEAYKDEIELIRAQNRVECDLYSIIACIIRERKNSNTISVRDVTTRRKTSFSQPFIGKSGFPDFVIRTREKSNRADILGAIEVKYVDTDLNLKNHLNQLSGHIDSYKKVIYTNGLEWQFYDSYDPEKNWVITLGEIDENVIDWYGADRWKKLLENLDSIMWSEK